jgi:hypothetical protein
MDVTIAIILVCGFLNLIPWIILVLSRPDLEIHDKLTESDSALAQLIQIIMAKLDHFEQLSENFGGAAQPLDFGQIIGQIIQSKMNSAGNEDYIRNDDGTFNGPPKVIESTPKEND